MKKILILSLCFVLLSFSTVNAASHSEEGQDTFDFYCNWPKWYYNIFYYFHSTNSSYLKIPANFTGIFNR